MAPPFITFEGLDGSGKSTHIRRASEWLQERGVEHCLTHEPGGSPLGEKIRSAFLAGGDRGADGIVEMLLVFASRRQHLLEVIDPALSAGRAVLCDRFTDSTLCYQGHGRGVDLELIDRIDEVATARRRPDFTVLFDLPAQVARDRGQSKKRRGRGNVNRFDRESLAFYERVRAGYLELASADPQRYRVVRSDGEKEATFSQLLAVLRDCFEL